jgi:hypothetical protein
MRLEWFCAVHNEAPTKLLKRSPCEAFSGSKVMPNPTSWMPFSCLVYALSDALQNNKQITGKWKHRSRVEVYLGWSPLHATLVALVLSLQTSRVSPQFHVQFDPTFQMMKSTFSGWSPESRWLSICGFTSDPVRRAAESRHQDASAKPTLAPRGLPPKLRPTHIA